MSNPFVTLIQCVTLLYLARQVDMNRDGIHHTVENTIKELDLPTTTIGENSDGMAAINIRNLISWMLSVDPTIVFDKDDIMTKLRMNLYDDVSYLEELESAINIEDDTLKLQQRINSINSSLKFELTQQKVRKLISRVNHRINYSGSYTDHNVIIKELQEDLTKFSGKDPDAEHAGFIGRLSTEDDEGMIEVFDKAKASNSVEGILQTGFQGMNLLLGGGIRRGEMLNVAALTHHYKSGMLLDLTRQVPIYNKPWMWDTVKKPMVLRVSFENKLDQDLPIIYKSLVEQLTGEPIDIKNIDSVKASAYVKEQLGVNGYTIAIECYDPNGFTIHDLLDLLHGYEAKGYEIHLLVVDYLELIAKGGVNLRGDEAINNAYEMLRNHCFGRGIAVVSAHQLSTEAGTLSRDNSPHFVKMISEGGWYRNTRSLGTKLDVEVFTHIYKTDEESYLTVARGKHRACSDTPIKHRSYFQKFHPVGGVRDDIADENHRDRLPEFHHGSLGEFLSENNIEEAVSVGNDEPKSAW